MTDMELADALESEVDASNRVERGWVAVPLAKAREIIAALRRRRPPSGEMVTVPREPTEAMIRAGYAARGPSALRGVNDPGSIYRAMLQAAEAEGRKS